MDVIARGEEFLGFARNRRGNLNIWNGIRNLGNWGLSPIYTFFSAALFYSTKTVRGFIDS